ncbi:hypothetical protein Q1695_011669 [Nippostrongylus brasiliensis]|nr:hypothetical protein Q1695_011669 [Nippostrongylus brasiliensis]
MRIVVVLAVLSTLELVLMLSCYHCVSQLPLEGIDDDARLAFKELVFQRYNVPPSHEFCDDSTTYDFYTAETQQCDDTDNCVKLAIVQQKLSFVMRGCLSQLLRPNYYLSQNTPCSNRGASQCLCNTELCNSSGSSQLFLIFIVLLYGVFMHL